MEEIAEEEKRILEAGERKDEKSNSIKYLNDVFFGDISFVFSGGIDMNIGPNSSMIIGLAYNRGLINIVNKSNLPADKFSVKNDMFLLEIGIRP